MLLWNVTQRHKERVTDMEMGICKITISTKDKEYKTVRRIVSVTVEDPEIHLDRLAKLLAFNIHKNRLITPSKYCK